MPRWQSGNIEVNDIRLHYTRTSAGAPPSAPPGALWAGHPAGHSAKSPVVLAHGFSDDGLCWTPVAEALAGEYDVIMVDARGHGRSAAPEQGYGPAEQADDLAGVIAALGLHCPAVLGHSMGAATTLVLAATYPDLPGAVLLEDPPAWWMMASDAAPSDEERQARRRAWITGLKRKTREELIAEQRAATPGWSEAELGPWADAKLRLSLNVLNRSDAAPIDWPATLRRITCPALLITADPARGALITEDSAAALQALIPQLRIAHIPEAGHNIRREQFERFMEVVRAFLAEATATA